MTDLAAKLKELARKNQLDPLGVVPTYRDGCEETEGNIDGWMVCELLRDFKGEPDVEDPFAVGLSRNAADLIAETLNALPQIIAALEARPPATEGNPDEEVSAIERVAHKGGRDAFVQGHDRDVPHNYSKHGLSKLWLNGWDHEKALSAARPSREEG